MISEKYLQKLVEQFATTKEGKKLIKEQTGIDYKPSKKQINDNASAYCKLMKDILFGYISHHIKSFTRDDIIVGDVKQDKNGQVSAFISFREGSLFRPSLQPDREWSGRNVGSQDGKYGIKNIVLHFSYGWNAKGAIQGEWRGRDDVWSRRSREGDSFLQDAIDEFNAKANKEAKAELVGEYAK